MPFGIGSAVLTRAPYEGTTLLIPTQGTTLLIPSALMMHLPPEVEISCVHVEDALPKGS